MVGACASRSGWLSSWVVRQCVGRWWARARHAPVGSVLLGLCVGRWWAHARHAPVGSVLLGLCAGVLVGGGRMRVTLRLAQFFLGCAPVCW